MNPEEEQEEQQEARTPRVLRLDEGPARRVGGEIVLFKARATDTDGAYSLFETRTPPGQGPLLHRERYDDETFYVLEGTYAFQIEEERHLVLGPGAVVVMPRGVVHTYTNVGEGEGRMLILTSPGGVHEGFFEELGEPVADPAAPPPPPSAPPDLAKVLEVAAKYGVELATPPPGTTP